MPLLSCSQSTRGWSSGTGEICWVLFECSINALEFSWVLPVRRLLPVFAQYVELPPLENLFCCSTEDFALELAL